MINFMTVQVRYGLCNLHRLNGLGQYGRLISQE
jgi:hypothetical protein